MCNKIRLLRMVKQIKKQSILECLNTFAYNTWPVHYGSDVYLPKTYIYGLCGRVKPGPRNAVFEVKFCFHVWNSWIHSLP